MIPFLNDTRLRYFQTRRCLKFIIHTLNAKLMKTIKRAWSRARAWALLCTSYLEFEASLRANVCQEKHCRMRSMMLQPC